MAWGALSRTNGQFITSRCPPDPEPLPEALIGESVCFTIFRPSLRGILTKPPTYSDTLTHNPPYRRCVARTFAAEKKAKGKETEETTCPQKDVVPMWSHGVFHITTFAPLEVIVGQWPQPLVSLCACVCVRYYIRADTVQTSGLRACRSSTCILQIHPPSSLLVPRDSLLFTVLQDLLQSSTDRQGHREASRQVSLERGRERKRDRLKRDLSVTTDLKPVFLHASNLKRDGEHQKCQQRTIGLFRLSKGVPRPFLRHSADSCGFRQLVLLPDTAEAPNAIIQQLSPPGPGRREENRGR
ncbi:hypothetical protein Q8A73_017106 [Channa argus]|nr:hypothetical protein Q8A73_017106 [Channa argus]